MELRKGFNPKAGEGGKERKSTLRKIARRERVSLEARLREPRRARLREFSRVRL